MWKECDSIRAFLRMFIREVTSNITIMIHSRTNIPPLLTVKTPGRTLIGFEMNNDFGARRCQEVPKEYD